VAEARTALVTGANRGLGLETCRRLARAGLRVVLTARDPAAGARAAATLGVEFRELDVGVPEAPARCAAELGRTVDVLVNNAGIYPQGDDEESWRGAFEVNVLGAIRCARAFLPGMVRQGWGRIVNVSSGYGSFAEGLEGPAPYSVSKAALNAWTVKLARGLPAGVKANAVCPGWVRTRMGGPDADLAVEEAVDTIVWLATLPDDGPTGGFFRERQPIAW